jgi:tRNA(Ile)-lysidine synthase
VIADTIRRFLDGHRIAGPLLAAISGGPDSTALLVGLIEIGGIALIAGHVNHHLRGAESDDDEAFVRELCARYDVPLRVADGSLDPQLVRAHGVEGAAREVRMERLQEMRAADGAAFIATAHQKNDQAETILMRLVTGGGLAALRGIHPSREDGVIRPLLEATRADVEAFLRDRGIAARTDRSNSDPRFLRNRVRAALALLDEGAVDSLAAMAGQAREQWRIMERMIDAADQSVTTDQETRFASLPEEPWLRQALLLRHIRRLDAHSREVSSADLARIAAELGSLKRLSVTRSLELIRRGSDLILRRRPEAVPEFELQITPGEPVFIPEIRTTARIDKATTDNRQPTTQRFQLPLGGEPRFTLRNRRDGDRFQPLGMAHEKKLKDFLIDRKIAVEIRDRIPLLVWNDRIVCVAGVAVSEAFKVSDAPGERYEVAIENEDQEGVQPEADRQPRS